MPHASTGEPDPELRRDATVPNRRLDFNRQAASKLRECGSLLRQQQANPFRVNAYLKAAATLDSLQVDVRALLREGGQKRLIELPGIGRGLAAAIEELAHTGRLPQLARLRGTARPEGLFTSLPGIGPALSHTIHEALHIDSLEALESAAYDGRLETVPGIGPRRLSGIRAGLASVLKRRAPRRAQVAEQPGVDLLLDVDSEYRSKAAAKRLPTIAPRRLNPDHKAWLPILHTQRADWHFTALFSNTPRAHQLGKTADWVVIFFYDGDEHREGQHTIVTETHGRLRGRRVVRGREAACAAYYGR